MIFNTDKIIPHGYFQTYVKIAGELGPGAHVLELGVAQGESLKMWQALFPLGTVTGVDISEGAVWPPGTIKIVHNVVDPDLPGKLAPYYNLIVDDASHHGPDVTKSFEILWPRVLAGGYYIVEDWMVSLRDAWRPQEMWGKRWSPHMLEAVQGFLPILNDQDAECDFITYRFGMCIIHKRA